MFDYQNSRARACPVAFLGDYDGYLQTDGYGAYDGLHQVTNVGCFAHARRKFMDAKKLLQGKGKSGKADKALALTILPRGFMECIQKESPKGTKSLNSCTIRVLYYDHI